MEHTTGSYDFVVVGTGTAGCVLAARLSENDAARVPSAPSGNTNATVYAIAERAAHLIQAQSSAAAAPSRTA